MTKIAVAVAMVVASTAVMANGSIHHNNIGGGGAGGAGGAANAYSGSYAGGGQGGAASAAVRNSNRMNSSNNNANTANGGSATAYGGVGYGGAGGKGGNAKQGQLQGQQQGQGQDQGQGQGQGQSQDATNNNRGSNVNISSRTKVQRNAPSVGLPAMFPTAVCQGTAAAGFSFLLGGGALGGSITVEECMKLEVIRVNTALMQSVIEKDVAIKLQNANIELLCMTKYGKKTSLCAELNPAKEEEVKEEEVVAKEEAEVVAEADDKKEVKAAIVERSVTWNDVTGIFN